MATLTMLDLAKMTGSDREIGLVRDITTYAPEVETFAVRPINGTFYKTTLLIALPTVAFRSVTNGVTPSKGSYEQKLAETFFIDGQLQVPEEIPDANDQSVGDVLVNEAQNAVQAAGITLGSQVWYGTAADANGFQGLTTFVGTSSTLGTSCAGTGAVTTSVWLVYMDKKGVHFVAGRTAAPRAAGQAPEASEEPTVIAPPLTMPTWTKQQVVIGTAGKVAMAYVSNIKGWIGLGYGSNYSAFRARNVSLQSAANYFTDSVAAKLLSQVPLYIRKSGALRWFMNRDAAYGLQISRSVVSPTNQGGGKTGALLAADWPTECQGLPITVTDSLVSTETAS